MANNSLRVRRKARVQARHERPLKGLDTASIKRALKKLTRTLPSRGRLDMIAHCKVLSSRQRYAKRLEPLLGESLPSRKIDEILARCQRDELKILKTRTPEMTRVCSALDEQHRSGARNRGVALRVLSTPGMPFTPSYILLDPFLIWAEPPNTLRDSRINPSNSWAKVYDATSIDEGNVLGGPRLNFYYIWRNPSAYYAVVNAQCSLSLRGRCLAVADRGILHPTSCGLTGAAELQPVEWWNHPPTTLRGPRETFMDLKATGPWLFSLQTGNAASKDYFDPIDLRYEMFAIPPEEVAVFRVCVDLFYFIWNDGGVLIDFNTLQSDGIACSPLRLELLTAPMGSPAALLSDT
jgi:hypothetical protein